MIADHEHTEAARSAEALRLALGKPALVALIESREASGPHQAVFGTQVGVAGVEVGAAEAVIVHLLKQTREAVIADRCPCPVCSKRIARFGLAMAALRGELTRGSQA